MKVITDIQQINEEQWQQLLQTSSTANWFQSPSAYSFYSQLDNYRPVIVAVENQNQIRGVFMAFVTHSHNPLKQFLTRRAVALGGPLLANDITDDELSTLLHFVDKQIKKKVIYCATYNFSDYSAWRSVFEKNGWQYEAHLNFHIDTLSEEVMNKNLGKSRKRDIRVSLRDGAEVIEEPTLEQMYEFYSLLHTLYKRKVKTPLFPREVFDKMYYLPDSKFILVQYDGKIVGGTVLVCLQGKAVYEWFVCGEDGKYKNIFPSELATYAGLVYASRNAYPIFDMMGAGKPDEEYGVRDFKAHFGGRLVEHGRFIRTYNSVLYNVGKYAVKFLKHSKL